MSISVFFSNKKIQIVVGKVKGRSAYIDKLIEAPMPDNSIMNGVIVPGGAENITEELRKIWEVNKLKGNANLIINSPQFVSNRKEMPIISKTGKITEYLEKQMSSEDYGRFESPLRGWYLLGANVKDKTQKVVTEIAEKKSIEEYIKIFSDAGITLESVHEGVNLANTMLANCVNKTTSLYMIRDDNNLVTILYINGEYYQDTTKRLFAASGTPEFSAEISNTINNNQQFARSQKIQEPITDVFFAGISTEDVGILQTALMETNPDIMVHGTVAPSFIHFKKWNDKLSSFLYPIAGLFLPGTGFSVLKAIRKNDAEYNQKRELISKMIPAAVLSLILLLVTIFLAVVYFNRKARLDKLQAYNSDMSVIQSSIDYDIAVMNASDAGIKQGGTDLLEEYIDSYPIPDSKINAKIDYAASGQDVSIVYNSYNSSTGVFAITASSINVENIHRFIGTLMGMEIFEDVDYTGYEWNEIDETWSIKVICTLSAGSSREVK